MDTSSVVLYLGPSAVFLGAMVWFGTFSLHRFRHLSHRTVTLAEWNVVFRTLGLTLENQDQLPATIRKRPVRWIAGGALALSSFVLFVLPLPFTMPWSFLQFQLDALPAVKSLVSGALLAFSVDLAFYRAHGWVLSEDTPSEYPFVEWKDLITAVEVME
jgi:hypothetical protein